MRNFLVTICLVGLASVSDDVGLVRGQTTTLRLTSTEAARHAGEVATVCGVVSDYRCSADGTILMLDAAGRRPTFQFVIPRSECVSLDTRLEDRLKSNRICASGRIEPGSRIPQMVINEIGALGLESGGTLPPPAFAPTAYHFCSGDVTLPKVIRDVKPRYTAAALRAGIQGTVKLDAVVEPNGSVGEIRVTGPLEPSLDLEAIAALKTWRFAPGTYKGKNASVVINVELSFKLGQ